ncbi:MAG: glycosyltransferase family 2 protein [Flavobacteriales bacterium]|nr:glycosyltransferase family 2 protein [Flavobacteriales bacterium]
MESILHGTYKDLEPICVDDTSTDGSVAVLRPSATPPPADHGTAGERRAGPGGQRRHGRRHREYIVRMDADDIAVPERIALQTAFVDAHPEVGASGGQLQLFGTEDQPWTSP